MRREPVQHFKCYKASTPRGAPKFELRDAALVDQFEAKNVSVLKPESFCDPVDKNAEGIGDPEPTSRATSPGMPGTSRG